MTKNERILSIALGRPLIAGVVVIEKIVKHFTRNKDYIPPSNKLDNEGNVIDKREDTQKIEWLSEDIDMRKNINSSYETTLDYAINHNKIDPTVNNTLDRLRLRNKNLQDNHILYDSSGKQITTYDEIKQKQAQYADELKSLKQQQDITLAKINNPDVNTDPNVNTKSTKIITPEGDGNGASNE